jgi:hypothetical protein
MGAISPQTSELPSDCLSYPSPTQDPVASPYRVVVERMAAQRLRLRHCLSPASKNQIQPSSGFRLGGESQLTSPLSSDSLPYPSPTQDHVASPKRVRAGRTAALQPRLLLCLTPATRIRLNPARGADMGRFHLNPGHCPRTFSPLPVAHPRPRGSTITSE